MFDAPHGAVCASVLAPVMLANLTAAGSGAEPASAHLLARYAEAARLLTGQPAATPHEGVAWIRQLVGELGIPTLRHYGIATTDFATIIDKAAVASSMKGNPVPLGREALASILAAAW
jgi:alcohol dehydrogenase class IV